MSSSGAVPTPPLQHRQDLVIVRSRRDFRPPCYRFVGDYHYRAINRPVTRRVVGLTGRGARAYGGSGRSRSTSSRAGRPANIGMTSGR
jgi:hypothetical protein